METTAIVSIGRGRPTDPNYVESPYWHMLKSNVRVTVSHYGPIVSTTYGTSDSVGWGEEESYTIVLSPVHDVEELRTTLVGLATLYGQDAIALTVGETDLVGPLSQVA